MALVLDNDLLSRLIELAHSAGLDQRKWGWFLKELSAAAGGARVQIFSHDLRTGQPLGYHEYGHDPDYLESYKEHFGARNPWIAGFPRLAPGQIVLGSEVLPDDLLVKTEFYNDWIRPQEDIIGSAAAILQIKSNRVTAIAANARKVDRERVEPRLKILFEALVPHLRQALEVSDTLGSLTLENRVLRAGLEPDIAAIFVLNTKGRICYANARGQGMIDRGEMVRIDSNARLRLTDPCANAQLARALHDRSLLGLNVSLPFVVSTDHQTQFVCQTTPLSEDDGPHPWMGPSLDAGRAYTLLILSPSAPHLDRVARQTSLG